MRGPPTAAAFKIWESGLTCKERTDRMDAYNSAKKQYRQEIDEYAKTHGCDNLSQSKLRALLAGNLIQSTGGKRLMQWRWQRFCEGKAVVRSRNYLKDCGLPEYTHFTPVPGVGFLGIPLNVWEYHIFPFMDDGSLWRIMLTSKQLQARAHNTLMTRAQREFGAGGTPMAIWCKLKRPRRGPKNYFYDKLYLENRPLLSCIRMTISKFGCMEHCRDYAEFQAKQNSARKEEATANAEFMDQAIARINSVTPEELHIKRVGLYNVDIVEDRRVANVFDIPYDYVSACQAFVNADEKNTEKIRLKLEKLQPDAISLTLIRKTRHLERLGTWQLFKVLRHEAQRRGVGWLENLEITQDIIEKDLTIDFCRRIYVVTDRIIDIKGPEECNSWEYNDEVGAHLLLEPQLKKLKC